MATHDYVIDNQTAPNFRADLNNALLAIVSNNSSATQPAVTYANMMWYDTAANILYMRNEDNDAWIALGTLNQSTNTFSVSGITNAAIIAGLGFTPVQQGGGVGQGTNKIFLGWDGSGLRLQVDNNSSFGQIALRSDFGDTGTQPRYAIRAFGRIASGSLVVGRGVLSYNTGDGVVTLSPNMDGTQYTVVANGDSRGGTEVSILNASQFLISAYSSGGNLINRDGLSCNFIVVKE